MGKGNIILTWKDMVDLKINVIKRDGRLKDFDYRRISDAIDKAYLEVYGHKCAIDLEDDITDEIMVLAEDNGAISVEEIQDMVEFAIMGEGKFDVAKNYIT